MAEFKLQIDGMHCGACVRRVTQALASVEGVKVNEVSVGASAVHRQSGPSASRSGDCRRGQAGFTAHLEA